MGNSLRRKIILSLLDCKPKSAQEISKNTGESLETVEVQLTRLTSENICEAVSDDEVTQWAVNKDIETFAQLVQDFISSDEPSEDEKSQFITSKHYRSRINLELVDHLARRFHIDSAYRTDHAKAPLQRLLLASPSALSFALNDNIAKVNEVYSIPSRLNSSDLTHDEFAQQLRSRLETRFLEMLIADFRVQTYASLYAKLKIQVAKISIGVGLAGPRETFFDTRAEAPLSIYRTTDVFCAGPIAVPVNPLTLSENALAFVQLGDFQVAFQNLDSALALVTDPTQAATIWNNKGLAFFTAKQYQKSIECFVEGIELDSENKISVLRDNKRIAEEYLARATDADNLDRPTRIRFVQGQPVPFEETLFYEFKTIKENSKNPVSPITNAADEYAVAFLNRKGGRIFWGIRDGDRITTGVTCNEQQRDEIRVCVSEKLGSIEPPISVEHWQLEFHQVQNLQAQVIEDLWVVELVVPPPQERHVFYTGSGQLFVKTDGGRKKLRGPEVTEFVRKHLESHTERGQSVSPN